MQDIRTQRIDCDTVQQLAEYIDSHSPKSVSMPFKLYCKFRREYKVVMKRHQPTYNNVILNIVIGDTDLVSVYFK